MIKFPIIFIVSVANLKQGQSEIELFNHVIYFSLKGGFLNNNYIINLI